MSEDKVRIKDLCGSMRAVYVLEKLPDVSGPGLVEVGHYSSGVFIGFQNKTQIFYCMTFSSLSIYVVFVDPHQGNKRCYDFFSSYH
jgi:hypothetical protein